MASKCLLLFGLLFAVALAISSDVVSARPGLAETDGDVQVDGWNHEGDHHHHPHHPHYETETDDHDETKGDVQVDGWNHEGDHHHHHHHGHYPPHFSVEGGHETKTDDHQEQAETETTKSTAAQGEGHH